MSDAPKSAEHGWARLADSGTASRRILALHDPQAKNHKDALRCPRVSEYTKLREIADNVEVGSSDAWQHRTARPSFIR
jgi:hypothetical protein